MKRPALGHILGYTALTVVLTAGAAQSLPGSNTVFSDDIVDGQVGYADIKNNAIGGKKILDNGITGSKVYPNTLTGADINESSLDTAAAGVFAARVLDGEVVAGNGIFHAERLDAGSYRVFFSGIPDSDRCAGVVSPYGGGGVNGFGSATPDGTPEWGLFYVDIYDGDTHAPMDSEFI